MAHLFVVLDAHAEGVDEDAEENEPLEDVVVDKGLQVLAELAQAAAKALNARPGDKRFYSGSKVLVSHPPQRIGLGHRTKRF